MLESSRLSVCRMLPLLLAGMMLLGAGCGSEQKPTRAKVTGTVTLDGKPLPRGMVYFEPDNSKGTSGPMSIGEIDENGKYTLKAAGGTDGAIIGHHKIRVEARKEPKDYRDTQPALITPAAYNNSKQSGLTAEVMNEPVNEINIELFSTGPKTAKKSR